MKNKIPFEITNQHMFKMTDSRSKKDIKTKTSEAADFDYHHTRPILVEPQRKSQTRIKKSTIKKVCLAVFVIWLGLVYFNTTDTSVTTYSTEELNEPLLKIPE